MVLYAINACFVAISPHNVNRTEKEYSHKLKDCMNIKQKGYCLDTISFLL